MTQRHVERLSASYKVTKDGERVAKTEATDNSRLTETPPDYKDANWEEVNTWTQKAAAQKRAKRRHTVWGTAEHSVLSTAQRSGSCVALPLAMRDWAPSGLLFPRDVT